MILVKKGKEIIQGVSDCFTLTLEMQTPFGEEPHEAMIVNHIKKELPLSCERVHHRISFLPLISFNSSMGRTHRFLVAFSLKDFSIDRPFCDRVLPLAIAFTAYAEEEMLKKEGFENLICGGYLKGHLFLLIFCEGKLVHWIQEQVEEKTIDLNQRLHRLRLFIQGDAFLSRLGDCPVSIASEPAVSSLFEKALLDPFWQNWDLDPSVNRKERAWKRLQRRFLYTFILAFIFWTGIFFLNQFLFSSKESFIARQAQEQIQQDSLREKVLEFQNQILSMPTPLDLDLLLNEIVTASGKGTRLLALKKIPSEEGAHFILSFSAIHFEEASNLERVLKKSQSLKIKKIVVGSSQSNEEGRVAFQMDLFL